MTFRPRRGSIPRTLLEKRGLRPARGLLLRLPRLGKRGSLDLDRPARLVPLPAGRRRRVLPGGPDLPRRGFLIMPLILLEKRGLRRARPLRLWPRFPPRRRFRLGSRGRRRFLLEFELWARGEGELNFRDLDLPPRRLGSRASSSDISSLDSKLVQCTH